MRSHGYLKSTIDIQSLLSFQLALWALKRLEIVHFSHRARSEDGITGGARIEGRAVRAGRAGRIARAGALQALKKARKLSICCTEPEVITE